MKKIGSLLSLKKINGLAHGYSIGFGNIGFRYGDISQVTSTRQKILEKTGIKWKEIISLSPNLKKSLIHLSSHSHVKNVLLPGEGVMTFMEDVLLALPLGDCRASMISFTLGEKRGIALLHGSWRSISKQYPLQAIRKIINLGVNPHNIFIGITPGICQEHLTLEYLDRKTIQKEHWKSAEAIYKQNNVWHLNTKKYLLWQYQFMGISKEHITCADICTYEVEEKAYNMKKYPEIYSHKFYLQNQTVGEKRFWSFIGMTQKIVS